MAEIADRSRPTVLLVDDHNGARRALAQLLKMQGYNVCQAASVQQALQCLDGQDFMVLDMQLPDGLGLTVLRKLRESQSRMKVAICSGSIDPALLDAIEEEHPDRVFSKPLPFDQLEAWLESAQFT